MALAFAVLRNTYNGGMQRLPKKLSFVPIIEAVAEFRFKSRLPETSAVLSGVLYSKLKNEFSQLERTALAELPAAIRQSEASLRYAAVYKLRDKNKQYILMVGDRVLNVAVMRPYTGWDGFKNKISEVLAVAKEAGVIDEVTRVSTKYINLLPAPAGEPHLHKTKVEFSLGPFDVSSSPINLRAEFPSGGLTAIVTIQTQARTLREGADSETGAILDVDIVHNGPFPGFWDAYASVLDQVHEFEKQVFISLLTPETLRSYGPEY